MAEEHDSAPGAIRLMTICAVIGALGALGGTLWALGGFEGSLEMLIVVLVFSVSVILITVFGAFIGWLIGSFLQMIIDVCRKRSGS